MYCCGALFSSKIYQLFKLYISYFSKINSFSHATVTPSVNNYVIIYYETMRLLSLVNFFSHNIRKRILREIVVLLGYCPTASNSSVRYSGRNCAGRSSRGGVIRSNSAAARRFWLSGRNRPDPPCAARNRTCNGMELRGDVPFANLLIPTREITTGRRRKRVFAKLVARATSTRLHLW